MSTAKADMSPIDLIRLDRWFQANEIRLIRDLIAPADAAKQAGQDLGIPVGEDDFTPISAASDSEWPKITVKAGNNRFLVMAHERMTALETQLAELTQRYNALSAEIKTSVNGKQIGTQVLKNPSTKAGEIHPKAPAILAELITGPMGRTKIAKQFRMSNAQTNTLMAQLEKAGLVAATEVPHGLRKGLTVPGYKLVD